MNCQCNYFGKTIQFVSPSHGGWGMIRIAALVPESYQLFVSPFACGRHGALGGIVNGIKDRISYLYIDESDIVSGNYENLIPDAVGELFENIREVPKVLLVFVSCLDDLLGTDHIQLNKVLSEKYKNVKFISCHMNPINKDTPYPPGVSLQKNIYSLLEKSCITQNAINLIGNNTVIDKDCEIYELMTRAGFEVRHISNYKTFEEYQIMAKSKLNVVLSPVAGYAARCMKDDLDIDFITAINTYDIEEIDEFYEKLEKKLGTTFEFNEYRKKAEISIKEAYEKIGNREIAIDYQAVKKPFTLARMLIKHGFNVKLIMTDDKKPYENEAFEFIKAQKGIEIVDAVHHDMVLKLQNHSQFLCIGFDCAYATNSQNIVNLTDDEAIFGYYGVSKLMKMLEIANTEKSDLNKIIREAGLVI